MPFLDLDTNIPQQDIPEDFAEKLCSAAASILGKPKERVNAIVRGGASLMIGGSSTPCVQLIISSIGVVGTAEQNKEHSSKFFEFLTEELSLPPDSLGRFYKRGILAPAHGIWHASLPFHIIVYNTGPMEAMMALERGEVTMIREGVRGISEEVYGTLQ